MTEIAVLGAGAWGTALANLAARQGANVLLWARDAGHIAEMNRTRMNARRLPDIALAESIEPIHEIGPLARAELVLAVVPTQAMRAVLTAVAPALRAGVPLVICAKGIEVGSGRFLSDVAGEALPGSPIGVLSGPSFAQDVARGLPTAVTLASHDAGLVASAGQALGVPWFRLYSTDDVRGVEIGGAAKNVLAIACGITAGRALGASASAALIARGFAELSRFGRAYGARAETLMGLSGLGDLVLTCNSPQSRNFAFGLALGRGAAPGETLVEGAYTAGILLKLAKARGVDMPIVSAVDAILRGEIGIEAAIDGLLSRPSGRENPEG